MKLLPFKIALTSILLISLFSCEKEEAIFPEPIVNQDTCTVVLDTFSLVIGSYVNMHATTYNHVMDLNSSESENDTLIFNVNIDNRTRGQIRVLKELSYNGDSSRVIRTGGSFYINLDSQFLFGKSLNSKYAFQNGDTLSNINLKSPNYQADCFYSLAKEEFINSLVAVSYDAFVEGGGGYTYRGWNNNEFNERFGLGYFCFRFLDGNQIKYGWVKMNLENDLKVTILEVAYMI